MRHNEQTYQEQLEMIQYNVANKPLMVEQGKYFIVLIVYCSIQGIYEEFELNQRVVEICEHFERS